MAPVRGPAVAGAGQHAAPWRGRVAGRAAGRVQAADPGGLDRPGVPAGRGQRGRATDAGAGGGPAGSVCAGFGPFRPQRAAGCTEVTVQGRTTVQPVQLSLLPDQVPAPPLALIGGLPAAQVEAALVL